MNELEPNRDKSTKALEKVTQSSNYFLLDTVRTKTPDRAEEIFRDFCKQIKLGVWSKYKDWGIPRNIANNHISMHIADIAYGLRPTAKDTPLEAGVKNKTIFYLIEAREKIIGDTRHKGRKEDEYVDEVLQKIREVDKEMEGSKIIDFPSGRVKSKRRSM